MRTSKSFNSSPVFYCGCLLVSSLTLVSSTMRTNCPGGIIAMKEPCGHRGGMSDPASPLSMIVTPAAVCSVHNLRGPPRPRAATHIPDPTALCASSTWPFRRHYGPYRAIPMSLTHCKQ
jgi:hypothetical protein